MNNLHPIFSQILALHGLPLFDPVEARRNVYVSDLTRHDWQSEFADDHGAFMRGRAEFKRLQAERAAIDPDAALWNLYCPHGFRVRPQ